MKLKFLLLALGYIFLSFSVFPQNRQKAFEINQRLGRGINMGNAFEGPSETTWGNPWKPEYFRMMAQLGFTHVRIPIRWEPADRSSVTPPYTIYDSFMNRIKTVVDTALKYKLYPVINMHHHDSLMAKPDANKARFLAQWSQIADKFKNYADSLVFELLNEPNGNMTAAKWNIFLKEALTEIRKVSPGRIILIAPPDWGGVAGLSALQLPDDENIILTVHYYNPFQFTHQGASWAGSQSNDWLGTKWLDTSDERKMVEQDFAAVLKYSQEKKIPVHVGEFGAYSKADIDSRVRWTTFLSRYFDQKGLSWAYWEFSAGFGIYNPSTKLYLTPLVDALLHNPMPQPGTFVGEEIFRSSFTSGKDGWSLNNQSGGAATSSASDGTLIIDITSGGTENWHIQLNKYQINLLQDKTYRISYRAMATESRSITVYAGMSVSPWSAYSGYSSVQVGTIVQDYSFIFNMKSNDPSARITFDLGKSLSDVTLDDIKLEILTYKTSATSLNKSETEIYPNPFREKIMIRVTEGFSYLEIFNLNGKLIKMIKLQSALNAVDTGCFDQQGIYIFRLSGSKGTESFKVVKF